MCVWESRPGFLRRLPSLLLLCLLCLSLPVLAAPVFAQADSASPARQGAIEESRRLADGLFQQGQYAEAYQMYETLLTAEPEHNGLLLGLARSGMLSKQYPRALQAYDTLRERFPNDLKLYQEASAAYVMAGQPEKASQPARIATLDGDLLPKPEEMLMGSPDDKRLQVRGRLTLGVMYDSNANQGPANRRFHAGDFPWEIDVGKSGKQQETAAGYAALALDLGYRLDDLGHWWWVTGGNFYIRGNTNHRMDDLGSREWQWAKIDTGLRYVDENNFLDIRLKGDVFDYEFNSHAWSMGPQINYVRIVTPKFHLITQAGLDFRDYSKSRERDGQYLSAGEYARFFFGESGHSVTVGGRYRGGFTDKSDYSYNGWEGSLGLNFRLPYNFELSPFVSYGRDYYDGPATALETEDREDKRFSIGSGLTYHIDEAWSVDLGYQFVNNKSESAFYDYDQHVVNFGVSYSF